MGGSVGKFLIGFPIIYALAWLSHVIAGNATVNYWGLEYVIFALLIGLFIGNVIGVPGWLMEAVKTEYYIKTGLVILGAGILFFEVLQAGALGIVQALLVVAVIWYICFWLSKKFRVDDEFAVMLAAKRTEGVPQPPLFGMMALSDRSIVPPIPRTNRNTTAANRSATRSRTSS